MSTVQSAPPVRHGTCRLTLVINDQIYIVRRVKLGPAGKACKSWSLIKPDGTGYCVTRQAAVLSCTCPDHSCRRARCKHLRALVAAGLLCGRTGPSLRARAQGVARV